MGLDLVDGFLVPSELHDIAECISEVSCFVRC